jgi:SAM-dependent methyltransferase
MSTGHWSRMGSSWRLVGPPLRPSAEDVAGFNVAISRWVLAHENQRLRALILGVTPELYALEWPAGTALQALDSSQSMIDAVWPGPPEAALVGSWTSMPLAAASCDMVVCDGGFGMLPYPQGQMALLDEVARVLAPGGVLAVRLFTPGGRTGSLEQVLADLDAHRIASLDVLKFRLWGALHQDAATGVRPRDVVAHILAACGSFEQLAEAQKWSLDHIRTMAFHRNSDAVYYLTDAAEVVRMATQHSGAFTLLDIVEPRHDLGACCPVVVLKRL